MEYCWLAYQWHCPLTGLASLALGGCMLAAALLIRPPWHHLPGTHHNAPPRPHTSLDPSSHPSLGPNKPVDTRHRSQIAQPSAARSAASPLPSWGCETWLAAAVLAHVPSAMPLVF